MPPAHLYPFKPIKNNSISMMTPQGSHFFAQVFLLLVLSDQSGHIVSLETVNTTNPINAINNISCFFPAIKVFKFSDFHSGLSGYRNSPHRKIVCGE